MKKLIVLLSLLILTQTVTANDEQKALSKAGEAVVKQFGIDKKLKQVAKKYVPDYVRKHSGIVIATGRAIEEERIEWKWEWSW